MTIEQKLKDLILARYGSIRNFTISNDLPNSTVDSILARGIMKSNVSNIIKVCSILNISADELANGRITPHHEPKSVEELIWDVKEKIKTTDGLRFKGEPLTPETTSEIISKLNEVVKYE